MSKYCNGASKFYYITCLGDMGENSKIDFFQFFDSQMYFHFHNDEFS